MGIQDRDYIREGPARRAGMGSLRVLSFNTWLILINIAVFLGQVALSGHAVPVFYERQLDGSLPPGVAYAPESVFRDEALREVPSGVRLRAGGQLYRLLIAEQARQIVGRDVYILKDPLTAFGHFSTTEGFFRIEVWRFVTFQFLHANWIHLAMNMFGLWVFGGIVESQLGSKRYAAFYLVCGIFGAVAYLLLNLLGAGMGLQLPGVLFNNLTTPLIGASAGVFGVIMASAYIAPRAEIIVFPIPFPLRLWVVAYAYVGFALVNLLSNNRAPGSNAGGDAAHIGGALAGYFFIRNAHLLHDFFDFLGDSRRPRGGAPRGAGRDEAEIDRILAKAKAHGVSSLSRTEMRTLRRDTAQRQRAG